MVGPDAASTDRAGSDAQNEDHEVWIDAYRRFERPGRPERDAVHRHTVDGLRRIEGDSTFDDTLRALRRACVRPVLGTFHRAGTWLLAFWQPSGARTGGLIRVRSCDLERGPDAFEFIAQPGGAEIVGVYPSDDGRRVALLRMPSGRDEQHIDVLDVETGAFACPPILGLRYASCAWEPDGRTLLVVRPHSGTYILVRFDVDGAAVGEAASRPDWSGSPGEIPCVWRNVGEPLTLLSVCRGTDFRNALYLRIAGTNGPFRQIQAAGTARTFCFRARRSRAGFDLLCATTAGAPRQRIVRWRVQDQGPVEERTLVPEASLASKRELVCDGSIVVCYGDGLNEQLKTFDACGRERLALHLPAGTLTTPFVVRAGGRDRLLAFVEGLTRRDALCEFDFRTHTFETLPGYDAPPRDPTPKGANMGANVVHVPSGDVEVPLSIHGDRRRTPRAVALYAYGGFGTIAYPYYDPLAERWVNLGNDYAVAHVRGGGERGEGWHRCAVGVNKYRSIEDLLACAQFLRTNDPTCPIVLRGASHGGLLVLGAAAQRPDLFAAVVADVPVTDLLRFREEPAGEDWVPEYGDPLGSERERLQAISPLHSVRPGRFPPTLLTTSWGDDRVAPWHSIKFFQRLLDLDPDSTEHTIIVQRSRGHWGQQDREAYARHLAWQLTFLTRHALAASTLAQTT